MPPLLTMFLLVIFGIVGAIGSGKSWTQMRVTLEFAERKRKQIVFNFPINREALYRYACSPKPQPFFTNEIVYLVHFLKVNLLIPLILAPFGFYWRLTLHFLNPVKHPYPEFKESVRIPPRFQPRLPWIKYLCENGGIIEIHSPRMLQALMIPESVVALDEAGVFLNAREFAKLNISFLHDLVQSRKDGTDLVWAAQFDEQVDKQFRLLTQFFVHCSSLSRYSHKLRRPTMIFKEVKYFKASSYFDWIKNPRNQDRPLHTRFAYTSKVESGLLSRSDRMIFDIFSSFARLDVNSRFSSYKTSTVEAKIVTLWKCPLPRNYYFEKLTVYRPEFDPFSYQYQPVLGWYCKPKRKSLKSSWVLDKERLDYTSLINGLVS